MSTRVAVIGAGLAGLVAALSLAQRGCAVTVFERASTVGGKMRVIDIDDEPIDAGPTVFTLREIFDEIFAAAGTTLEQHLKLRPLEVLARHAWREDERLDLYADAERSAAAVGEFAGAREAHNFRRFSERARGIYQTLEKNFIRAPRVSGPFQLARRVGLTRVTQLAGITPFSTLWQALSSEFRDPRLRQLFGRYATYCGSSPFAAPATLMLVAHVEQRGVWSIDGGMHALALALQGLGVAAGVKFRFGAEVSQLDVASGRVGAVRLASGERFEVDAAVVGADVAAIASGRFGASSAPSVAADRRTERSLSAVTWALRARTHGFPLERHNVFFSSDYRREFDDIFKRHSVPSEPTVYVCAQDRDGASLSAGRAERLLVLINAPPLGDIHRYGTRELARFGQRAFDQMKKCGLDVERVPQHSVVTSPTDFEKMFPATGGALYGRASHGWRSSFERAGSRTRIPNLYLAGGSVHPGPGVPMAAVSGQLAAAALLADCTTTQARPQWRARTPSSSTL